MSATGSEDGPDDAGAGSWASESLPMSVRKELLERELNKLGLRKATAQGGASALERSAQQQPDGGSSRPQADTREASGPATERGPAAPRAGSRGAA